MADESIISYSDLIGKDNTFKDIDKEIKRLEKSLLSLANVLKKEIDLVNPNDVQQINELDKKVQELTQAKKNLTKAEEINAKAKKKNIELTNEELIQREQEKNALRERVAIAKQQAILQKAEKDSIEALRARLALTTIEWKKLTSAETTNTAQGRLLTAQKLELTNQLKKLEKATGDHRREVGNYTLAGNKAASMVSRLGVAGNKLTGVFGRAGRALDSVGFGAFALAAAAATIAWQFFADNIIGNSDEIIEKNKELKASIEGLTTDLTNIQREGKFLEIDNSNLSEAQKRLAKIGLLQEDLGKADAELKASANEASELASRITQNQFKTELEKNEVVARALELDIKRAKLAQSVLDADKEINKIQDEGNKAAEEASKKRKEAIEKEIELRKKLEADILKSNLDRLAAIEEVQARITELEIENIKDKQERLLALEDLRIKQEQQIALDGTDAKLKALDDYKNLELERIKKGSDEEKALVDKIDKEIAEIELLNQRLSEEQLKASEIRKQEIRKEFALSTEEIAPINVLENKQLKTLLDEKVQLVDEANKDIKDSTDNLVKDLGASFEKLGNFVVEIFDKQAELSGKAVEQQQSNLDRANERAANGLEANIAFEEQKLAEKQAEQIKRQKEAKIAAEAVALLNLVSAYAQSGDKNALQKGLTDWGILKGLSAILEGFYDGTEDTGTVSNGIDSKGGRLAILHNNERVVTKAQNKLLGGMSNEQLVQNALLGSQMSDYLPTQNAISQNLFDKQKADFGSSMKAQNVTDSNDLVVKELQQLNKRLSAQPNIGIEIEKVYGNVYDMIKTETKTGMIKRGKKRL
jgi:hypothetical protein